MCVVLPIRASSLVKGQPPMQVNKYKNNNNKELFGLCFIKDMDRMNYSDLVSNTWWEIQIHGEQPRYMVAWPASRPDDASKQICDGLAS